MKNLKNLVSAVTALLFMLCSNNSMAANITSINIDPSHQSKTIKLLVESKGVGTIYVKFLDDQEKVIFSDKMESPTALGKIFNLQKLENGSYTMKIEDEFKITNQPINIYDNRMEIDKDLRVEIFKPRLSMGNENHLDVNWLMNQADQFQLSIYDYDSILLFEDKVEGKLAVHKSYDLSKLPAGTYFIKVENKDYTAYKTIYLKAVSPSVY